MFSLLKKIFLIIILLIVILPITLIIGGIIWFRSGSQDNKPPLSETEESENIKEIKDKIITCLNIWKERDGYEEAKSSFNTAISSLNNPKLSAEKQLEALKELIDRWSTKLRGNWLRLYELHQEWITEIRKEQTQQEEKDKKNWFGEKRWLTDVEIDWAVNQLSLGEYYKTLPAHQFCYVKEVSETGDNSAFSNLLKEINDDSKELVFIPVNNPYFHWSLLVYETSTKTFCHYDTLKGANDSYVKPLVEKLSKQIGSENDYYFQTEYSIYQGNGHDCGVAVIAIIERIIEKYDSKYDINYDALEDVELGELDFTKERKKLREKHLTEQN